MYNSQFTSAPIIEPYAVHCSAQEPEPFREVRVPDTLWLDWNAPQLLAASAGIVKVKLIKNIAAKTTTLTDVNFLKAVKVILVMV
jgi:hypothetical protein